MKKLFAENKDSRTNEHTKRDNTIWLQRLSLLQAKFTFAKSFDAEIERQVFDVTSTTAVNQYIAADTNSRPRDIVE